MDVTIPAVPAAYDGYRDRLRTFIAENQPPLVWANKAGARTAVIVGEAELARGVAQVRDLDTGAQDEVAFPDLAARLT